MQNAGNASQPITCPLLTKVNVSTTNSNTQKTKQTTM